MLLVSVFCNPIYAQQVPGEEENIPFLMTFGKQGKTSDGDNDFSQTFFFKIPKDYKRPVFIRIFDPEIGGMYDEKFGVFNTKVKYTVYGGKGAYTQDPTKSKKKVGLAEKSGNLIYTKTFSTSTTYDNKWFTIGPLNPSEAEYVPELDGYIFKIVTEGIAGDDGNLYRFFLTSNPAQNIPIEGGNAFTFEYSVRLYDSPNEVSHLYPYVDENVIAVKQHNFDWDNDGNILIYSIDKVGEKAIVSGDDQWKSSQHKITKDEKGSCLDFQIVKSRTGAYKNNNVVFYVTNQYGEYLPFYSVPIGVFTPQRKITVE